jgi:hypothetical protein
MSKKQRKNDATQKTLKALVQDNLPHFIKAITEAGHDPASLSGAAKLDHAVGIVNGVVDIPLLPEWAEELVFKAIITAMVELAKHLFGKAEWIKKLQRPTP